MRTAKSNADPWFLWEKQVADDLHTIPVVGSGNTDFQKGDVVDSHWFIDCKYTDKESYSVKNSLRDKYEKKAQEEGRDFIMALNLNGKKYAVIDYDTFLELQRSYYK